MTFKCKKCHETFESNGLRIVAHEKTVGHVCPGCLANTKTVHLILEQPRPGEFSLSAVELQKN